VRGDCVFGRVRGGGGEDFVVMNLKLEMLRVLDVGTDSVLFPAATLLNQVRLAVKPTPTYAEFDKALLELETQRLIVGVRDRLDEKVVKYKLTDAGKATLAEFV
jgi:hypothetical protein